MAIDFPSSPTNGTTYSSGGLTWTFDGVKWVNSGAGGSGIYLPLAGGTITGNLTVNGASVAVTKAPGDNSTNVATTAFATSADAALGSNAAPVMDGTAAPGVAALFARGDHVHPSDTSRAAQSSLASYLPLTGGNLTGNLQATGYIYANGAYMNASGYGFLANAGVQTYLQGAVTITGNATFNAAATYVGAMGSTLNSFGGNGSYVWGSAHYSNWSGGGGAYDRVDTTAAYMHGFLWGTGSLVGTISTGGSSVSYNSTSDGRLKRNVRDIKEDIDVGALIDAIRPVAFEWKNWRGLVGEPGAVMYARDGKTEDRDVHERVSQGTATGHGFVAQELIKIAPHAVHAPDNGERQLGAFGERTHTVWGVDFGKLVPYLVAEVQALRKRVAQLEGAAGYGPVGKTQAGGAL